MRPPPAPLTRDRLLHLIGRMKESRVGMVGDDTDGATIRQELAVARLEDRFVLSVAGRPTTSKTRIIARSQQIVRIDDEVETLLEGADLERLTRIARDALADGDALLLE